jgi:hypothetical protein
MQTRADLVLVGVTLLFDPGCGEWYMRMAEQHDWHRAVEQALLRQGVRPIKLYDAIDSIPFNGAPDEFVSENSYDCIHPNALGNQRIADYLRFFAEGRDHSIRKDTATGNLMVEANYTQGLVLSPDPAWKCVQARDLTSGLLVPTEAIGNGKVVLATLEGHDYRLSPCNGA